MLQIDNYSIKILLTYLNAFYLCMKIWILLLLTVSIFVSCNREVYKLQPNKSPKDLDKTLSNKNQKLKEGVDFIVFGNDPKPWSLEMDFDNQFSFKTVNDSLTLLAVPAVSTATENIYTLQDRAGSMSIVISNHPCADGKNQKKTTVNFKGTSYSSCGEYVIDQKLNAVWEIVALGTDILNKDDFKDGLPRVTIDLEQHILSASSTCLAFKTEVEIKGQTMKVNSCNASVSPKCTNTKMLTHFKEKILGQWVSYKLQNDKLYLYLIDDSNVTLRRIIR